MRKVMFFCHTFYPETSGYSIAFQNLINSILHNITDVYIKVFTPYPLGYKKEIQKERLEIIRLKKKINLRKIRYFVNDYFYAKEISETFKSERFDVLFIETFDQFVFINSLDSDIYDRVVVRIHGTNETEYTMFGKDLEFKMRRFVIKNFIMKKVINIAATNSYYINFAKKYFLDNNMLDIADKRFFVIPNVVDVKKIGEVNIEVGEKIKLVFLARMDKLGVNQKGFLDFIYALKLAGKKNILKYEITIIGKGDLRNRIIELCKEFENVKFIDNLPNAEVINLLKQSDVIVLPSRYEGLSMFALEGLACGNAVIFSKTGGLIDLVDGNGFMFEPQDIESLASTLVQFASLPKEEIIKMKARSMEIIREKFIPEVVAKRFNFIYDVVCGR